MSKGSTEKPRAVITALTANLIIAASKFLVAFLTGSSAMLSEAFHSTADTGNEILLFVGLHNSRRPPDEDHPFGHGQEVYFWSLIIAIMLFSTAAGSAIYEGLRHLGTGRELGNPLWSYVVLAVALATDGYSWLVSFRELSKIRLPGQSFWETLETSKDPSILVVFGENSAGVVGIFLGFFGTLFGQLLRSRLPDLIASVLIGLVLAAAAIWLALQSKSLLIGETANKRLVAGVQKMINGNPAVSHLQRPLTMHLGPRDVLLCLDVQFKP